MKNKVKLVAIAKDEGAYLVDWIFHHLYFGFYAIDIYVNRTSDNTFEIADKLKSLEQVRFLDGDAFLKQDNKNFQTDVYFSAYQNEANSDISHILFLDIDEFWTPANFKDEINTCISSLGGDVISFEWFVKTDEETQFKAPFSTNNFGNRGRFVKSISSLGLQARSVQAHNIHADHADYRLADGTPFKFNGWKNGRVSEGELKSPLKDYFVVHRMFRSQMEYLSLLARGRPSSNMRFKDNRAGYPSKNANEQWEISEETLSSYNLQRYEFIERYQLKASIDSAREFIKQRYKNVLRLIETASREEAEFLESALQNIDISEALTSYASALKTLSAKPALKSNEVDTLRKVAFTISESYPRQALMLLELAKKQREKAPIIDSRIKELKAKLNLNAD